MHNRRRRRRHSPSFAVPPPKDIYGPPPSLRMEKTPPDASSSSSLFSPLLSRLNSPFLPSSPFLWPPPPKEFLPEFSSLLLLPFLPHSGCARPKFTIMRNTERVHPNCLLALACRPMPVTPSGLFKEAIQAGISSPFAPSNFVKRVRDFLMDAEKSFLYSSGAINLLFSCVFPASSKSGRQ